MEQKACYNFEFPMEIHDTCPWKYKRMLFLISLLAIQRVWEAYFDVMDDLPLSGLDLDDLINVFNWT